MSSLGINYHRNQQFRYCLKKGFAGGEKHRIRGHKSSEFSRSNTVTNEGIFSSMKSKFKYLAWLPILGHTKKYIHTNISCGRPANPRFSSSRFKRLRNVCSLVGGPTSWSKISWKRIQRIKIYYHKLPSF